MSDTTREPVAWLVLDADGVVWDVFLDADAARSCALDGACVPLYRDPPPPTLTDAEREAIHVVRACAMTRAERYLTQSDREREATLTLMGLLERQGGGA